MAFALPGHFRYVVQTQTRGPSMEGLEWASGHQLTSVMWPYEGESGEEALGFRCPLLGTR